MKFYIDEKEYNSKYILDEFIRQYADNFQHLGTIKWSEVIKPNIELLLATLEQWKDDSKLEFDYIRRDLK